MHFLTSVCIDWPKDKNCETPHCPSIMVTKFYTFVNGLFLTETPRTVVQSLVGIFHAGVVKKGTTSFTLAKKLYLIMSEMFELQYGNVLLATGTWSQLQTVIDNEWPFFANYTETVKTCLEDSKCDELQDIFEKLG